jgi:hypothetical protein
MKSGFRKGFTVLLILAMLFGGVPVFAQASGVGSNSGLIKNGDFSQGTDFWNIRGNASAKQHVQGLKPNTIYTLSVKVKANQDIYANFGVSSLFQSASQEDRTTSDQYVEKRITFKTFANQTAATVFLYALKSRNSRSGEAFFKHVSLIEGNTSNQLTIENGDFESGKIYPWVVYGSFEFCQYVKSINQSNQ